MTTSKRQKLFSFSIIFTLALLFAIVTQYSSAIAIIPEQDSEQDGAPDLFQFSRGPESQEQTASDPSIARVRQGVISFEALGGAGTADNADTNAGRTASSAITLNLFDDTTVVAVLDRIEPLPSVGSNGYAWIGTVQEEAWGQVVFAIVDGKVSGTIRYPGAVYHIQPSENDLHQIQEIDTSLFQSHPPGYNDFVANNIGMVEEDDGLRTTTTEGDADRAPTADDGSVIDVMVVYTEQARMNAGGTAAMQAFINLNIVETNLIYQNSLITPRIRLVHTYEVDYLETADPAIDLARLETDGDGYMDSVHTARDTYGADLVALLTNNAPAGFCGIGHLYTGNDAHAFSVTLRGCASTYLTFAHELGHNMGARHDWFVDSTTGEAAGGLSDNHGRAYPPGSWQTVMSYDNLCGGTCDVIPYFSNPDVNYSGVPTGIVAGTDTSCTVGNNANPDCDADNARTLDAHAFPIANFRQSKAAVIHKTASTDSLVSGFAVGYTLEVNALASTGIQGVIITDRVPANATLYVPSLSGDASYNGTTAGSIITWTTGVNLSSGGTLTRTFAITGSGVGTIENTAYLSSTGQTESIASNTTTTYLIDPVSCGFRDSFESGALNLYHWTAASSPYGRIRITDSIVHGQYTATPYDGRYGLFLDSAQDGTASVAIVALHADFTGESNVNLDFWWREYGDEEIEAGGILLSDDYGETWVPAVPFSGSSGMYERSTLDIDQLAGSLGLSLNDKFAIGFLFDDDLGINPDPAQASDGYGIDDIRIRCDDVALDVSKEADQGFVFVNSPLQYTITIENYGTATATNLVVSDTVPAGTSYIAASATGGGTESAGVVTWNIPSVAANTTVTRTFSVQVLEDTATITNTAYVSTSQISMIEPSNTVTTAAYKRISCGWSDDFETGTLSNVWLTSHSTEGRVRVGNATAATPYAGNYTLLFDDSAYNSLPSYAFVAMAVDLSGQTDVTLNGFWRQFADEALGDDGIFLSDDDGATYVHADDFTAAPSTYSPLAFDVDAAAASGGLTLNDSFVILIQFSGEYPIDESDPGNSDGYGFDNLSLDCGTTTLDVSKSVDKAAAKVGELLEYTITVTNTGGVTATHLLITDTLPSNTAYVPNSASDGGVLNNGELMWAALNLVDGATITRTFQVTVAGVTTISNSATAVANNATSVTSNIVTSQGITPTPSISFTPFLSGIVTTEFYVGLTGCTYEIWRSYGGPYSLFTGPITPITPPSGYFEILNASFPNPYYYGVASGCDGATGSITTSKVGKFDFDLEPGE